MLELLFSDSAGGSLKMAAGMGKILWHSVSIGVIPDDPEMLQRVLQEEQAQWEHAVSMNIRAQDVYVLHFGLSVGDICEQYPDQKRLETIQKLFSFYPQGNDAANELMHNDKVAVILATGGTGLVKAAYSSGKPAYGVGPGNVPAYIERSADISLALDKILASKTFDNGTICASEQSIIVEKVIYDQAKALLKEKGGYFVTGEDAKKLSATVIKPNGGVNADVVGKAPQVIADLAGISMPEGTRVFVVELDKVGTDTPLSAEKLCPVLAFYTVENWVEACELCMELLEFGGLGHSLSIHSNNDEIIEQFGLLKPVSRILVNSPSSQGGIGYTTGLNPSLTLGCGTFGGNIASENITPLHLMNKKRIAYYNAPADFVLPTVSPVRQTGYSHEDIVAAVERALKNL